MTTLATITAGTGADTVVNQNFEAVSAAAMYGRRAPATAGLTWAYYGGRGFGNTIADGTVALTGSATNYVVASRSTGAVSVATSTTNWDDETNYFRVRLIIAGAASITAETDYREFGGGGGGGGGSAAWGDLTGIPSPIEDIAALTDPGADRLLMWDDSAGEYTHATLGTNLSFTGTTLNAAGGGGGTSTFIGLTDVPVSYTGSALQAVRVNSTATALEFYTPSGGSFTGGALTSALDEAKGSDIARATTTNIGAATGNFVHLTGTTTVTGLGTVQAGTRRIVRFAGAGTLTHNATSLILPGGANITTAVNDCAIFVSEGSGNWRCVAYSRANGTALVGGGGITGFTPTLNTTSPNNTTNASVLTASGGTTNQDVVLTPKGNGAIIAGPAPDGTLAGGNKRGTAAFDAQISRTVATQVASGGNAFAAGSSNTASGLNSFAVGASTQATGSQSASFGSQTQATGANAVAFGVNTVASGAGCATFGLNSTARTTANALALGSFSTAKQARIIPLSCDSSSATPVEMTSDGAAGSSTNRILIPNYGGFKIRVEVCAYCPGNDSMKTWEVKALAKNVTGSAAAIVGTPTVAVEFADALAAAWTVDLSVSGTSILVSATGASSMSIVWSAVAYLVEATT